MVYMYMENTYVCMYMCVENERLNDKNQMNHLVAVDQSNNHG